MVWSVISTTTIHCHNCRFEPGLTTSGACRVTADCISDFDSRAYFTFHETASSLALTAPPLDLERWLLTGACLDCDCRLFPTEGWPMTSLRERTRSVGYQAGREPPSFPVQVPPHAMSNLFSNCSCVRRHTYQTCVLPADWPPPHNRISVMFQCEHTSLRCL